MSTEGAGPGPIEHLLHDIRTPLSIISGNVHILHKHWERLETPKREGLLRSAMDHTETLNKTLRSLNHVESIRPRRGAVSAVSRGDDELEVEINLDFGTEVRSGSATAPRELAEERRAVVRATLEALSGLLPFKVRFGDGTVVLVGDRRLALVSLGRDGGDTLVGSAIVRTDEDDAFARATLDAVNRFLLNPALV